MIYDASPLLWPEPSASWDSGVLSPASPPPLSRPLIHTAFAVITLCLAIHFLLLILPGLPGSKTNSIPCPGLVLPLLSSCFNCADFHPPHVANRTVTPDVSKGRAFRPAGVLLPSAQPRGLLQSPPHHTQAPANQLSLSLSLSPELTHSACILIMSNTPTPSLPPSSASCSSSDWAARGR